MSRVYSRYWIAADQPVGVVFGHMRGWLIAPLGILGAALLVMPGEILRGQPGDEQEHCDDGDDGGGVPVDPQRVATRSASSKATLGARRLRTADQSVSSYGGNGCIGSQLYAGTSSRSKSGQAVVPVSTWA